MPLTTLKHPCFSATLIFISLALGGCVTETTGPHQPAPPDLHAAARYNTQLGMGYISQNRFEVAETKLKKAIEQDEGIAQAHSGLAFIYWHENDIDGARSEFRRAVSLDSADPEIRNNYGAFLCSQGKYEEGDSNLMLALKNRDYTTPAKAWTNAGICAQQAGDAKRAEANFRSALRADPNYADALAQMVSYEYQQQNYLAARAFLERYQKAVAQPSAGLLLLGFKTERALDNEDAAHQYSLKLIRSYPESPEAAQLLKLRTPAP